MRNENFAKIKVTNLISKEVYFHSKVPYEHINMLKFSPNLSVEIVGKYIGDNDESKRKETVNKSVNHN